MNKRIIALILLLNSLGLAGAAAAEDVSVTIYNTNLGVVRETRDLTFKQGSGRVSFIDVPTLIDPTSVGFELTDKTKSVAILEQNYAYDLVSPEKIYAKYIDLEIDVFNKDGQFFSGTLLSHAGGALVLRDTSGKIQIIRMDQVVNVNFPELPEGLITRPTLFWLYRSDFSGTAKCHVSYQTGGMSWSAEYVGILSEDEEDMDLTGWSSISNSSGATYRDATLKLIAGDIHRAPPPRQRGRYELFEKAAPSLDTGMGFEEKEFFEYHLYTLPRKATIANNEIKQIALFEPAFTPVDKEYYFEPEKNPKKVRVSVKFANKKEEGLGIPLPAGRVRVFKADTDGSMVLLGEDRIDHTPKDEEVKLTVGYAFDIAAEEKLVIYDKISARVEERTYEIMLRNHKNEAITVFIEKKLYGDWQIIDTTHEYKKIDAGTIRFELPVDANGKATITFKVRTS
ncbi:MAG: DUF4139 domain-containing protein [Candidatus Zixiibacteriota bacterium]|nr:MAG: DUF4139 domain-containing protein [candidate division Zixibacteria bacterium]